MKRIDSWPRPAVPELAGEGVPVQIYDSASERLQPVAVDAQGRARLYVCGITPYDATHLGHAATYLAFDTLVRALLQAGVAVDYAQNVTDVDDPLFERATATGVDWQELATSQTDLYRADMTAMRVIPPQSFVRVQDVISEVGDAVQQLIDRGLGYPVPTDDAAGEDIYFDLTAAQQHCGCCLGHISHYSPERLSEAFVEFGGDPERPGKRSPFDPLLWRAKRDHEPGWASPMGTGRPGWHIECSVIATGTLGPHISVQGGGRDLRYPHHEMSAAHAVALTGEPFAQSFVHAGLIAYEGEKMSKSRGNLVLVSRLLAAGHEAAAIRLAILAHHYRSDWEWTSEQLTESEARLARWRDAAARAGAAQTDTAQTETVQRIRAALANDLDTPGAIALVDDWTVHPEPSGDVVAAVDALLGVDLRA